MAESFPTPQPPFPGDTIMNPEEDFWAPWPEGTESAPGQRGEFTDIPKQSPFGAYIPPASGASPNRDDTQRKEELPAMYNPDRVYGRLFHDGVKWINTKRMHLVTSDMEFDAFLKEAATREEYLASLFVDQQIIAWVMQQDDATQKYLIGLLRKDPRITLTELQEYAEARAEKNYKPEPEEVAFVKQLKLKDPALQQWMLYVLKKARVPNTAVVSDLQGSKFNYEIPLGGDHIERIYGVGLAKIVDSGFLNSIATVAEWYAQAKQTKEAPQLASLTFPQALEKAQAANAQVVYQFPDGWTIRKLLNPAALNLESLRMDNCVGKPQYGWVEKVTSGQVAIYSLRDENNDSCATIAVDRQKRITEALGPENEQLGDVEVAKIGEWAEKNDIETDKLSANECEEDGHDWDADATIHVCNRCGEEGEHDWERGGRFGGDDAWHQCQICGASGRHDWDGGQCTDCGEICDHPKELRANNTEHWCEICGAEETHEWDTDDEDEHRCDRCGYTASHDWSDGVCDECGAECTHEWEVTGDQLWYCEKCESTESGIPPDLQQRYQFDVPGDFDARQHAHAFVAAPGVSGASAKVCRHCGRALFHESELEVPQEVFPFREEEPAGLSSWLEQQERKERKLRKTIQEKQRERGESTYKPIPYVPPAHQMKLPLNPRGAMMLLELEGFIKRAGSREEYLQSLNAQPDVIQFVLSQPEEQQKWFINEVRKNPALTLQQLQALQAPQKENPYTSDEYTYVTRIVLQANLRNKAGAFTTWALTQVRKNRSRLIQNREGKTLALYKPLPWESQTTLTQTGEYTINDWWDPLLFIADWYRASDVELASYSLEQAWAAQQEWHNTQARAGDGTRYEEHIVIKDLGQLNPQWQGWTLQEVRSENDLECEGNKMNHCVGSYAEEVAGGNSFIYSLRDPKNEPHVTIETNASIESAHWPIQVVQIQGKGNSEPKPEYQQMLKAVFKTYPKGSLLSPNQWEEENSLFSILENVKKNDYPGAITDMYGGEKLDPVYGLIVQRTANIATDFARTYQILVDFFETSHKFLTAGPRDRNERRHNAYAPVMGHTAETLAVQAIEYDKTHCSTKQMYENLTAPYALIRGDDYGSAVYCMKAKMNSDVRWDARARPDIKPEDRIALQMAEAAEGVFQEYAKTLAANSNTP